MKDPSTLKRAKKYAMPDFLRPMTSQKVYERWLHRKAIAHARRDKKRGNANATNEAYKIEIHRAVSASDGKDAYTKETLDWSLLSKYNNESSRQLRRAYKAGFALLPTVDHVNDGIGPAHFTICAWRTNDAKNDLSLPDFIDLCRKVVAANLTIAP